MNLLRRIIIAVLLIFLTVVVSVLIGTGFSALLYPLPPRHISEAWAQTCEQKK